MLKDLHDIEPPPHPGEILREDLMPTYRLTKSKLCAALKIGRKRLDGLLDERRPVTPDLAQRLGVAFGLGPQYWLGLQLQHDLWLARTTATPGVKPISRPKTPPAHVRRFDGVGFGSSLRTAAV